MRNIKVTWLKTTQKVQLISSKRDVDEPIIIFKGFWPDRPNQLVRVELSVKENDKFEKGKRVYCLDGGRLPNGMPPKQKSLIKSTSRNEGERFFEKFLHEVFLFDDQQRIDFTYDDFLYSF